MKKTNAVRLLEQAGISFETREYLYDENDLDGRHAADGIGMPYNQVFKTLVSRGASKAIYVFCLPVCDELDLKKAAQAAGEKSIELIHVKELLGLTGYIRGGCSPIGMKKRYTTFICRSAAEHGIIGVSGGIRGLQLLLKVDDLLDYTGATLADITKQ